MSNELKEKILSTLQTIESPEGGDVLSTEVVAKVGLEEDKIRVLIRHEASWSSATRFALEDKIYDALIALDGIDDVTIDPTIKGAAAKAKDAPEANAGEQAPKCSPKKGLPTSPPIPGVKNVIAVASGKGGVGKSTVAVNLALALAKEGHQVGLLDIDIYGPSLQLMLGVEEKPSVINKRIQPVVVEDMKLMSLGFLIEENAPVIWRGPLVNSVIKQFIQDVDWQGTDYLIVDLPPGTGDAQLSLVENVPVDGAIIVTTPSDLALLDAARGLNMFQKLDIPVLGIVENMSHYLWPGADEARALLAKLAEKSDAPELEALSDLLDRHGKVYLFGEGGGAREAERLKIPLLAQIPLDGGLRAGGDAGKPVVLNAPDGAVTKVFLDLGKRVAELKPHQ